MILEITNDIGDIESIEVTDNFSMLEITGKLRNQTKTATLQIINDEPLNKGIHIIILHSSNTEYEGAAKTRIREIENSEIFKGNKVYYLEIKDLANLKGKINKIVNEAKEKELGKTLEVSFYGHHGVDGPNGDVRTSRNNMEDYSGSTFDRLQMTVDGWNEIDFNFKEDASVAAFYGCLSTSFAQKFAVFQKASHAVGFAAQSGVSEEHEVFDANWFVSEGEDLYMMDAFGIDIHTRPDSDFYELWERGAPEPTILNFSTQESLEENSQYLMEGEETDFSTNIFIYKDSNGEIIISGHKYKK